MSLLIKFLYSLSRFFPRSMLKFVSFMGDMIFLLGIRKKVLYKNLNIAFPEKDANWRRYIGRNVYRHFLRQSVLSVYYASYPEKLVGLVDFINFDIFKTALDEGRPIFYFTAHLGLWEILPLYVSYKYRRSAILYQKIRNEKINALVLEHRSKANCIFTDRGDIKQILTNLRNGLDLGLLVDQRPIDQGYTVKFFNVDTRFYKIPFKLLKKFNAIPLFVFCYFSKGRIVVEFKGSQESSLEKLIPEYAATLESFIKKCPEQYFWLHNRWRDAKF